jgi:hypothetical protein
MPGEEAESEDVARGAVEIRHADNGELKFARLDVGGVVDVRQAVEAVLDSWVRSESNVRSATAGTPPS